MLALLRSLDSSAADVIIALDKNPNNRTVYRKRSSLSDLTEKKNNTNYNYNNNNNNRQ